MGSENDLFVPSAAFETSDGEHVFVVALAALHWRAICEVLGKSEWLEDGRFADNTMRLEHRAEIHGAMADVLKTRTAAEWSEEITAAGGFCERVRDIEEVWADDALRERAMLASSSVFPSLPVVSLVRRERGELRAAPGLGQHTAEVARELGLPT